MLDGKFGYVDSAGKLVIPIKFSSVSNFNNTEQTIAEVTKQGENMWIDLTGKKFEGKITSAGAYLAITSVDLDGRIINDAGKFGFAVYYYRIDSTLRKGMSGFDTVVKPMYENLFDSDLGILIAKLAGALFDHYKAAGHIETGYYIMFIVCGFAYIIAWLLMQVLMQGRGEQKGRLV